MPETGRPAGAPLRPELHSPLDGQGEIVERVEDEVLEPGAFLAENGDDMDGARCPMAGHEAGQVGIAVGHLERKGQIADVFEDS